MLHSRVTWFGMAAVLLSCRGTPSSSNLTVPQASEPARNPSAEFRFCDKWVQTTDWAFSCEADEHPVDLRSLRRLKKLKVLTLTGRYITDARLAAVAEVHWLKRLNLGDDIHATKITDAGLAYLRGLTSLETLVIKGGKLSDAGMAHIGKLGSLRSLELSHIPITEAGVKKLVRLRGLRKLDIYSTKRFSWGEPVALGNLIELRELYLHPATDAGLAFLPKLTKLRKLSLGLNAVTDNAMAHVRKLHQLAELVLHNTLITDDGLADVAALRSLRQLNLAALPITDVGVAHLVGLSLADLNLYQTQVTDSAVPDLVKITSLRYLNVHGTHISRLGVAKLKRALPHCQIVY